MRYFAEVFGCRDVPDFFIEDRIGFKEFAKIKKQATEILDASEGMEIIWIRTKIGMVGFAK